MMLFINRIEKPYLYCTRVQYRTRYTSCTSINTSAPSGADSCSDESSCGAEIVVVFVNTSTCTSTIVLVAAVTGVLSGTILLE